MISRYRHLTPRQRECLRLAAAGLEHREIAERIGIGYASVRTHIVKARELLGAHNTAHAVAIAAVHGIVTADDLAIAPREDA